MTSRFLNVISLFNKAIPLISIQIRALEVGDLPTLHATRVLDLMPRGTDEEDDVGPTADRAYWTDRVGVASLGIADEILALINETGAGMSLNYNRHYIGLARDGVAANFVFSDPIGIT